MLVVKMTDFSQFDGGMSDLIIKTTDLAFLVTKEKNRYLPKSNNFKGVISKQCLLKLPLDKGKKYPIYLKFCLGNYNQLHSTGKICVISSCTNGLQASCELFYN